MSIEKIVELQEALCQANGKLIAIANICEQEVIEFEENKEEFGALLMDDHEVLKGRAEFAEQIMRSIDNE